MASKSSIGKATIGLIWVSGVVGTLAATATLGSAIASWAAARKASKEG